MFRGKALIYSKRAPIAGPYAGGPERQFHLADVQAWGKLSRYGDAIKWTIARLTDGTEVMVVASEQQTDAFKVLGRITRKMATAWHGEGVQLSRDNTWNLRWAQEEK